MSEKVYVPKSSAKERRTKYGPVLSLSFHAETLTAFVQQHANARGWINFNVSERKSVGERGDTHSVTLDTWEPTRQDRPTPADAPPVDADDIPF